MRDIPFIDAIAGRKLVLRRPELPLLEVVLEIGRPVALPSDAEAMACPFRLTGLPKEEKMYAVGIDSVQALQLALGILPSWLELTAKEHGGVLEAHGGSDYGFA